MACSTTGSFDVRTGANVKYQRESHTLLKDRDVQMSWNGELTAGNARPIGGNILIKIREQLCGNQVWAPQAIDAMLSP